MVPGQLTAEEQSILARVLAKLDGLTGPEFMSAFVREQVNLGYGDLTLASDVEAGVLARLLGTSAFSAIPASTTSSRQTRSTRRRMRSLS
jgi:hypothetical protein